MITRLYLVRHGATPLTKEDRFSGAENVDLSEEGRRQVQHLAQEQPEAGQFVEPGHGKTFTSGRQRAW